MRGEKIEMERKVFVGQRELWKSEIDTKWLGNERMEKRREIKKKE